MRDPVTLRVEEILGDAFVEAYGLEEPDYDAMTPEPESEDELDED